MNIDLLSKMVKEMLLDSGRVVLPGLGVFTAEPVPASFSDNGYTVNPPYKRLHFRARDEHDDRLAAMYAVSDGVGMDEAVRIVSEFTEELKHVLQRNKTVVFPGLGRLRATKENNFFFVPDEDLDIYPEGFGLEPLSLKSHVAEAVTEDAFVVTDDPADEEETVSEVGVPAVEEPVIGTDDVVLSEDEEEADRPAAKSNKEKLNNVLMAALVIAGLAGVALLVFLVLADAFPDFIDSILYSKEELEILNYKG